MRGSSGRAITAFRSTPLREGRRWAALACRGCSVSIHAPARGATRHRQRCSHVQSVRSTPLREGRPGPAARSGCPSGCFDPRPCARGDWGSPCAGQLECMFRSTPLREGRRGPLDALRGLGGFDPRPCARGDATAILAALSRCFDPRPCARGDACREATWLDVAVSIHAPARGATGVHASVDTVVVFRSTPLREGRPGVPSRAASCACFDPRPCARGDRNQAQLSAAAMFRSTPLREGRHRTAPAFPRSEGFDPRPCARGDNAVAIDGPL